MDTSQSSGKVIKIVGWAILIWALLSPLIFLLVHGFMSQGATASVFDVLRGFLANRNWSWFSGVLSISHYLLAPLFLIFSIGLIRLKNWGRVGLLTLSYLLIFIFFIVSASYFIGWMGVTTSLANPKVMMGGVVFTFLSKIIVPVLLIWFLGLRGKTKEVFGL